MLVIAVAGTQRVRFCELALPPGYEIELAPEYWHDEACPFLNELTGTQTPEQPEAEQAVGDWKQPPLTTLKSSHA